MNPVAAIEAKYRKAALPTLKTGDTVRVHQLIKEGNKQRIQVFEGVVIRRHRMNELSASITVRRIASGVGVEKTFLMHSPNVSKVEILRRSKVRRNFLSYLRERRGKSARLREVAFDRAAANAVAAPTPEPAVVEPTADTPVDEPEVIDEEQNEDALNDAEPISDLENAENKEAVGEDSDETDVDQSGDHESGQNQEEERAEVEQGEDRAEPGEGKAVQS
jgi:large subunit ribosomal protein L19